MPHLPETFLKPAGKRIVSLPELFLPGLRMHLNTYAGEGDEGLVFIGPKRAQLRRANFTRTWSKAISAANLTEVFSAGEAGDSGWKSCRSGGVVVPLTWAWSPR
jgi:hypothetical protein